MTIREQLTQDVMQFRALVDALTSVSLLVNSKLCDKAVLKPSYKLSLLGEEVNKQ